MPTALATYLRNHEAAAQAGRDLFRRVSASQGRRPYGAQLVALTGEVESDLATLRAIMRRHRVSPDPLLGLALRAGERVGRLKPNGALLRRPPVTDLVELEGLLDAVRAKAAGWSALAAAAAPAEAAELDALGARADAQAAVLADLHRQVAARLLVLG